MKDFINKLFTPAGFKTEAERMVDWHLVINATYRSQVLSEINDYPKRDHELTVRAPWRANSDYHDLDLPLSHYINIQHGYNVHFPYNFSWRDVEIVSATCEEEPPFEEKEDLYSEE